MYDKNNFYVLLDKCKKNFQNVNDEIWVNNFLHYLQNEGQNFNSIRFRHLIEGQFLDNLICLTRKIFSDKKFPILVCVVRNELVRMQKLLLHYRKLGIFQFVVIDNDSSDGTLEYCLQQSDVAVFSVKEKFSSPRHVAWINQVLSYYGYERWYLVVDSDELLDYVGSESYSVGHLLKWAEKNEIYRLRALQVEMYNKLPLFSENGDEIDWESMCYFDCDSYESQNVPRCPWIVGGPRKRVLNTYSLLTKFPLFYLRRNDLNISMHYLYPYEDNFKSPCFLVLKHYEFINVNDYKKMNRIISQNLFASDSREYKEMAVNLNSSVKFYHENSVRYNTSNDLLKISEVAVVKW